MTTLEITINLNKMTNLSVKALSRIIDANERAMLTVRYPIGEEPPDGEIYLTNREEIYRILPKDKDQRYLSIGFVEVAPTQEEPSLVSVDFINEDDPVDPPFNINFDV